MRYSETDIEEVRSRNDIVDVIGSYVNLKMKGKDYWCCCPFHHEKSPSFKVDKTMQLYHCFGCGVSGSVYTFLMEYEQMTFPESVKYLADRCGYDLPEQETTAEQRQAENYKVTLKDINKMAAGYFHYILTQTEDGKPGLEYLHKRGLSDDTIYKFGMGFANVYNNDLYLYLKNKGYTDKQLQDVGLVDLRENRGAVDKFRNRVMVPILDINGKVIGFGGRVIGPTDEYNPKYLNTKETIIFDKGRNLFALQYARRSKRRGMIICEGYMDVIAMHQAGFDNAVASLGTAFTIGQATLIKRYTDEVYLAYDSDGAGTKATLKNIGILRQVGLSTRVINMKPYKDPDEFIQAEGKDAYEERIKNAVTGIVFEIDTIATQYNLQDPGEKSKFANEAAKRLCTIEETVERHSYIDAVSKQYELDKDGFKALVTKYGTLGLAESTKIEEPVLRNNKNDSTTEIENPTQSLLLTWMVNNVELFESLNGIISVEDFVGEEYKNIATKLYKQYEDTGNVNPAAIINSTEDVESQRLLGKILQTELPFEVSKEEREKAINDVVKKMKAASIDYGMNHSGGDIQKIQTLIKEKANLNKLHITLKSD